MILYTFTKDTKGMGIVILIIQVYYICIREIYYIVFWAYLFSIGVGGQLLESGVGDVSL